MRTLITFPDGQIEALAIVCRRQNISRAEAVRRAVKLYLEEEQRKHPDADVFGLWAERSEDGVAYQRRLRSEWS